MRVISILTLLLIMLLNASPKPMEFVPYQSSVSENISTSKVKPANSYHPKYTDFVVEKKTDFTIPILLLLSLLMMIGIGLLVKGDNEGVTEEQPLRDLRYAFEHIYLPLWLFDNPFNILNYLLDYREEGIYKWWNILRADPIAYGVLESELDIEGIAVFYTVKDNVGYVIVKMPQPKKQGDSYYLGLIVPQERPLSRTRYFSLEYAVDKDNNPTTNLFERTVNDNYMDYGNIVTPRIDLFEEMLELIFTESYKLPKNNSLQNRKSEHSK